MCQCNFVSQYTFQYLMGYNVAYFIGDDSVAEKCKNTEKPYVHTCPLLLRELVTSLQCPLLVYNEKVSKAECHAQYQIVLVPQNRYNICNVITSYYEIYHAGNKLQTYRQKFRLTHDALYNLHKLVYDMNEFFLQIATFQTLL